MNTSTILQNQALTDLQELRKDIDCGMYDKNTDGFISEMGRINAKINKAVMSQEFEQEQDGIDVSEEEPFDEEREAEACL